MKAGTTGAPPKVKQAAPDFEEAFEEEDDGEIIAEPKDEDEELDLKKDKYIKAPKKKPAAKGKAAPKKKAAKKGDEEDMDVDESEEDVKPKKKAPVKRAPKAKK